VQRAAGIAALDRLPRLAKLGVDFVSMDALTHSARAMDPSLDVTGTGKRPRKPKQA
jgi:nicotinate-nucleotide pyrophosphorylase (carboxylating)